MSVWLRFSKHDFCVCDRPLEGASFQYQGIMGCAPSKKLRERGLQEGPCRRVFCGNANYLLLWSSSQVSSNLRFQTNERIISSLSSSQSNMDSSIYSKTIQRDHQFSKNIIYIYTSACIKKKFPQRAYFSTAWPIWLKIRLISGTKNEGKVFSKSSRIKMNSTSDSNHQQF